MLSLNASLFQYEDFSKSPYQAMAKTIFVLFQILIPILLLNMLIAMMGNTYAIVIEKSEKEFLKQWAKVIMSIERSIPPSKSKENLESYSIAVSQFYIDSVDLLVSSLGQRNEG